MKTQIDQLFKRDNVFSDQRNVHKSDEWFTFKHINGNITCFSLNDFDTFTDDILNLIKNDIGQYKGVYFIDSLKNGIFKKPTLYIWTYKNMDNILVNDIFKLNPSIFELFDSHNKNTDKIIIKINKTELQMPIIENNNNKKTCVIN